MPDLHSPADERKCNATSRQWHAPANRYSADIADSPLQEIHCPDIERAGVRLLLKRDDLMHPLLGGNKWRKLKYNIAYMQREGCNALLTFGGAWSNHIHATAAAGKHFDIETIGVIRGDDSQMTGKTPNHTLQFARHCGMHLHFIDRQAYRNKHDPAFLQNLLRRYADRHDRIHVIPEGGNNALAMRGCSEIVAEVLDHVDSRPDVICCSAGTGTTLAGIVNALQRDERGRHVSAIGFSALKMPGSAATASPLHHDIDSRIVSDPDAPGNAVDWHLETRYHFGGYARADDRLARFIRTFRHRHGVPLDMVYTGKMLFGLTDMIGKAEYPRGTTIVALHSGGLQGNRGFPRYQL